jgi:hypothetical protein
VLNLDGRQSLGCNQAFELLDLRLLLYPFFFCKVGNYPSMTGNDSEDAKCETRTELFLGFVSHGQLSLAGISTVRARLGVVDEFDFVVLNLLQCLFQSDNGILPSEPGQQVSFISA